MAEKERYFEKDIDSDRWLNEDLHHINFDLMTESKDVLVDLFLWEFLAKAQTNLYTEAFVMPHDEKVDEMYNEMCRVLDGVIADYVEEKIDKLRDEEETFKTDMDMSKINDVLPIKKKLHDKLVEDETIVKLFRDYYRRKLEYEWKRIVYVVLHSVVIADWIDARAAVQPMHPTGAKLPYQSIDADLYQGLDLP